MSGQICERLLKYLKTRTSRGFKGKSTGRELFGPELAADAMNTGKKFKLPLEDILATVSEFTVQFVVREVRKIAKSDRSFSKLYLTGGGRRNMFYCNRLRLFFPNLELLPIDDLGVESDLVEAAAFAVMGEATIRSEAVWTGVGRGSGSNWTILGDISQPPAAC